jgi:hypothetical protein
MMKPTIRDIKQIITNVLQLKLMSDLMYNDKRKDHNRIKFMAVLPVGYMSQLRDELTRRFPNFWFRVTEGEWNTSSWPGRPIPVTLVRFGLRTNNNEL